MAHEATGTQPKAGDEAADTAELHGIRFDTENVIQLLRRFHVARIRAYGPYCGPTSAPTATWIY